MSTPPNAQLSHVGMFVRDIDVMTGFYCKVLGMVISDAGHFLGRDLAFLSRTPNEHHQVVMIQDPTRQEGLSALSQLSYRLDDLEALREYHAFLGELRVAGLEGRNHGNSWSLYFFDPEGNKIELYVPTPWHFKQPWRAPLDLTLPADVIVAQTEALAKETPATMLMEDWKAQFVQRMIAAQSNA